MKRRKVKTFEKYGYLYTKSTGRIRYTPTLHTEHKKSWSLKDLIFLCGMWDSRKRGDGKSIALGLDRTYSAVMQQVAKCKKDGDYKRFVKLFKKGVD